MNARVRSVFLILLLGRFVCRLAYVKLNWNFIYNFFLLLFLYYFYMFSSRFWVYEFCDKRALCSTIRDNRTCF